MRKLLLSLALVAVLLTVSGLSGCSVLSSLKPKEYRCTIAGEPEPTTAEDYYLRAINHAEISGTNATGDFDECAMAALNESLRLDSNHFKALRMRGYGYYRKKKYDLALADAEKAVQIKPDDPSGYSLRSGIFDATGLLDKAITDQNKAIELTPKENSELHYRFAKRADYHIKKGDYQAAAQDFTEAIRLKPDYKYHYSDRAKVYRKLGNNELAEADEEKAGENNSTQTSNGVDSVYRGTLNKRALDLAKPEYPPAAKAVRAAGEVKVQVTIDENGNVISASAIRGHPLLKAAAESAARASKFAPTVVAKKPVKVTGFIIFDFIPE